MLSLILAAVCFLLYRRVRARDPRRQRMAVFFLLGLWFAAGALAEISSYVVPGVAAYVFLAVVLLAPLTVLFMAGLLIANGLRMFRREGRSLGNSLSGVVGVLLLVLPVLAVVFVWGLQPVGGALALMLVAVCGQVGVSFLVYWTFAVLYRRGRPRSGPDAVVVLGSGLVDGTVPPLLAARLDLGQEAFARYREGGRTVLIPSGGKGPDEPRAEAEAMSEYLEDHGVAPQDVIPETRSRTTQENLRFSREVADGVLAHRVDAREGGSDVSPRQLLVVTNGYHAPRAALLSRQEDIDADVIGAQTARYFVPSAFLREFAAVVVLHRWLHLAIAAVTLLPTLVLLWEGLHGA